MVNHLHNTIYNEHETMRSSSPATSTTMASRYDFDTERPLTPQYLHYLAQNLNNQGGHWITEGKYDAAIVDLKQALELTKMDLSDNFDRQACSTCEHCSLQSFLTMMDSDQNDEQSSRFSFSKVQRINRSITSDIAKSPFEENSGGFIYRRVLLVRPHCINHCHYMGTTLSFMILFNIALAHHLQAIETLPFVINEADRMEILQQPMKLYELAYQLHFECKKEWQRSLQQQQQQQRAPQSISSSGGGGGSSQPQEMCDENAHIRDRLYNVLNLRIMMLVTNNIGEIHKMARNATKHNQCLKHLLNGMMYMNQYFQGETILTSEEKDGIFDNLSPLLRTKEYAEAA